MNWNVWKDRRLGQSENRTGDGDYFDILETYFNLAGLAEERGRRRDVLLRLWLEKATYQPAMPCYTTDGGGG